MSETTPEPPISCEAETSFDQMMTSASATYSLISNYQGSISVSDPKNEIDFSYVLRRYDIDLSVSSTVCADTELTEQQVDCFSGNVKIVSGIINNISYSIDAFGTRQADIQFDSFYSRLNSKAVSTDPFLNLQVNDVLEDMAVVYLGVPEELLNFNAIQRIISGPSVGNNAMEELRNIAQAGFSHIFVQTDGRLTVEPWLGFNCVEVEPGIYSCEAAEIGIPCTAIKSASRTINNEIPPTVIRVRGGSVQTLNCGKVDFMDTRTSAVSGRSGYESIGGGLNKTVVTGIPQKDAEVSFFNLTGKKEDLYNANVATTGLSIRKTTEIADGKYSFSITGENGTFLGKGASEFFTKISGQQTPEDFKTKKGSGKNAKKDGVKTSKQIKRLPDVLSGRPPIFESGPAFGAGTKDGVGHNDPDNSSNEASRTQLEVVVYDSVLLNRYGVKEEQLDNPYIYCKEDLFRLAIRRFQQWYMEQNAWELDIAPMPCLRINQMVEFTPPPSASYNNPQKIKGVISGISYDWSGSDSGLTQKLTILGVDSLCKTTYNSSNLIINLCGINGDGQWSGSGTQSNAMGNISNDCLFLYTAGIAYNAFVFLTQTCMEIGGEYTVVFQAEQLSVGLAQVAFKVTDSLGATITSLTAGTNGTYTLTFTATDDTCVLRWDLMGAGGRSFWRIYNINLLRTIVG